MSIRPRAFASLLGVGASRRTVLACGITFAIAQVAACGSQISVGHGLADSGGSGGSNAKAGEAALGGSGSSFSSAGHSAGRDPVGVQGGSAQVSCTGSLAAVNQALGPACPTSLCEATAWTQASCSLSSGVLTATEQRCAPLRAIVLHLGGDATKTCIYMANRDIASPAISLGVPADGDLVGIVATDVRTRFCAGTSNTISAGQSLPADCVDTGEPLCKRRASDGNGGAANGGLLEAPVQVCFNYFSGSCEPCCPAAGEYVAAAGAGPDDLPDCSDKPDGYPGYSCTPSWGSYCSCQCSRGKWECGC